MNKKKWLWILLILIVVASSVYIFFNQTGPISTNNNKSASLSDPINFSNEQSGINLISTKLATIPQEILNHLGSIQFTNDGKKVVFSSVNGEKIFINGKGESYSYTTDIFISPNQQKIAWGARIGSNEFVVLNFIEGEKYSSPSQESFFNFDAPPPPYRISDIYFSPDSLKMVYPINEGRAGSFMVFNDSTGSTTVGRPYFNIGPGSDVVFSPDSSLFAYRANITLNSTGQKIIVNGGEEKTYDQVSDLRISPDSGVVAYTANQDGKQFVVINRQEEKIYDAIEPSSITFSPDSFLVAYVAREGGKDFLVINNQEIKDDKDNIYIVTIGNNEIKSNNDGIYDGIERVVFSPDSNHIAYSAYTNNGSFWKLVVDGQESSENYPVEITAMFSPDSQKFAFVTSHHNYFSTDGGKTTSYRVIDDTNHVVISMLNGNKTISKEYKNADHLTFSPDSHKVAYIAGDGTKDFVVLDSIEGKKYDELQYNTSSISGMTFSPDSQKLAYVVIQGNKMMVVVNEKEKEQYDFVTSPTFSSDSKKIMYGARKGNELWWIVNDVE